MPNILIMQLLSFNYKLDDLASNLGNLNEHDPCCY